MSLEQLTGAQMDAYERLWTRVMLAAGTVLITALALLYVFRGSGLKMLVLGTAAGASIIVMLIAAVRLRRLERGLNGSNRGERANTHSALETLDD